MTTLLLVRHGATDVLGRRIVGRLPGISLNDEGRAQAAHLVERLAPVRLVAIYSSPLERCLETCTPLSERTEIPIAVRDELTELDFGQWSGALLDALREMDAFQRFNAFRSGSRPPGGETLLEAQARMVTVLRGIAEEHPGRAVAVFGHGDPLKAAVAFYLGMSVELIGRLAIEPASVTTLLLEPWGAELRGLNAMGPVAAPGA